MLPSAGLLRHILLEHWPTIEQAFKICSCRLAAQSTAEAHPCPLPGVQPLSRSSVQRCAGQRRCAAGQPCSCAAARAQLPHQLDMNAAREACSLPQRHQQHTSASAQQPSQTASAASKPAGMASVSRRAAPKSTRALEASTACCSGITTVALPLSDHGSSSGTAARCDPTASTFLRSAMTAFTSSTAAATAEDCSPSPAGAGSKPLWLGMPLQIAAGLLLLCLADHQLMLHDRKHCSPMKSCTWSVLLHLCSAGELWPHHQLRHHSPVQQQGRQICCRKLQRLKRSPCQPSRGLDLLQAGPERGPRRHAQR